MIDRVAGYVLQWAAGHIDEGRYSPVGIAFHWTMAGLAFFQLGLGWWMGQMSVGGAKVAAYELHYAAGVLMFVLALGRVGWRLLAPGPINDADKPGWESVAGHVTHYIFYACLFGLPLSGWAMVSATGRETELTLIGLTSWPLLPLQDLSNAGLWAVEAGAEWVHWGLIVTLLLLIPIHIGAALKHHLIDRDDVLHAMLPVLPKPIPRRTRWRRRYLAAEKWIASQARRLTPGSRRRKARKPPPS